MEALCFKLKGKTAFFKKPEVNSYYYFTYGNIHKVALLGIFGAVLGCGGYTKQYDDNGNKKRIEKGYPEFYEKLSDLKVSVSPNARCGFIEKKIQQFNNSVGYASKEQGGNLLVKEQWLENPSWDICVLLDCEEAKQLANAMQNHKCVYLPYLGKNDHFADILEVHIEEAVPQKNGEGKINSLFVKQNAEIVLKQSLRGKTGMTYKYQENLPIGMDPWTNHYILKTFLYTDADIRWEQQDVYQIGGQLKMFH